MKLHLRRIVVLEVAILLLAVVLLGGCAAGVYKPHPGTANTDDSLFADFLQTTDSVIQQTKADLASGAFPAQFAPGIKSALNRLIAAYDDMRSVWLDYHNAALAGQATNTQVDAVLAAKSNVNVASSNLTNTIKAAK